MYPQIIANYTQQSNEYFIPVTLWSIKDFDILVNLINSECLNKLKNDDYIPDTDLNIVNIALVYCSRYGYLDVIKKLVEKGAKININNHYNLSRAGRYGQLEIVKFLVEKGANIHTENDLALRWASYNGYLEIVKYLVEKGANIHAENDYAIIWANRNGHTEIVKYLKSLYNSSI